MTDANYSESIETLFQQAPRSQIFQQPNRTDKAPPEIDMK